MKQSTNASFQIAFTVNQIIDAIETMEKEAQENFIEDLFAALSPRYLESIKEARLDYKENRVYSHEEVFA